MYSFSELMAETGDILGIEGLEPDAEGVCILASDEAEIYLINCPEAGDMILITSSFMPLPPDGDRALVAALKANHLFEKTRGATLSLDPETEMISLSRFVPLAALTPEFLINLVEEFSSALVSFRSYFEEENFKVSPFGDDSGESPEPHADDPHNWSFVKP